MQPTITRPEASAALLEGAAPYELSVDGQRIWADPRDKGEPGDVVVVWPKKRGPRMARRLARCIPYDLYYFMTLGTEELVAVPCNKVVAVHKVIEAHEQAGGVS